MTKRANYREIAGPNGLLARREAFVGNSMSATWEGNLYVVKSYRSPIYTATPLHWAQVITSIESRGSVTTSRHRNLCKTWL